MPNVISTPVGPRGFRRVAPALILFVVSPYVAEYLLGNLSISVIGAMLFIAPLYGGGALLIRELVRRTNRGWPTIILFAIAYGLVEEGLALQTLFNPNYLGLHLLKTGFVPSLGIGAWWTIFVLTIHTVWSISVPIAVVEALFAERRTTPWLGNVGFTVSILLFVGGAILNYVVNKKTDPFAASPAQLLTTCGFIALFIGVGLRCSSIGAQRAGTAPPIWIVGVVALGFGLAHMGAIHVVDGWTAVGVYLALGVTAATLLLKASRAGWTPTHTLAAAGGAMLAYACSGFPQEPSYGAKGTIDLVGNIIFAAIAVMLLVLAAKSERRCAGASLPAVAAA